MATVAKEQFTSLITEELDSLQRGLPNNAGGHYMVAYNLNSHQLASKNTQ